MGVCTSCTHKSFGAGKGFDNEQTTLDGANDMSKSMSMRLNKMRTLSAKDIKGFKKADSINAYYDIEKSIGQGSDSL